MPYICPNCGIKLINYDDHIIDQYCPKCDYYNDQNGKEYHKHKKVWIDD